MKKLSFKTKSSAILCALFATISPIFCTNFLTSCGKRPQPVQSEINLYNTQQTIYEHSFSMPFTISNAPLSPVSVQIVNDASKKLSITRQQIFLSDKNGQIDFEINAMVDKTTHFSFDLEFFFINSTQEYQKIKIDDLNIYYLNDPLVPIDEVTSPQKSISKVNEHDYEFRIQFYNKPQGNSVFVHLQDNVTGAVESPDDYYTIKEMEDFEIYYIDVPVTLSFSEAKTSSHSFSFEVTFTNSFGIEQTTVVPNFNAYYISEPVETIPQDYYNIVSTTIEGKQHNVLLGLRPEISMDEAERYSVMVLPDIVTDISTGAFIDSRWFKGIEYLKVSTNLRSVGEAAFVGCTNVFELDLSSNTYASSWLNEDAILFNELEYENGFVWFDDTSDMEENLKLLKQKGLSSGWQYGRFNQIIPDSFYVFDEEDPTKLIGIQDEAVFQLHKYGIVRVPKKTTIIAPNAFNEISTHPFKPLRTSDDIDLRKFLMHDGVMELHSIPKGLEGNITFKARYLKKLDDGLLERVCSYPDFTYPIGNLSVDMSRLEHLEEIGTHAFADTSIVGSCVIPPSVKKIHSFAFNWGISKFVLASPIKQTDSGSELLEPNAFNGLVYATELDFSVYTKPPFWLDYDKSQGLFNMLWNSSKAVFYINKNATDEDLDNWKQKLYNNHGVPVKDVFPHSLKAWEVIRRPY